MRTKVLCQDTIMRRSDGIGGLKRSTPIEEGCGRQAAFIFRPIRARRDGRVYLGPWRAHCAYHSSPGWEEDMRRTYPGIGDREIKRSLEESR